MGCFSVGKAVIEWNLQRISVSRTREEANVGCVSVHMTKASQSTAQKLLVSGGVIHSTGNSGMVSMVT